jgi:adenylate cyclase class IV
MIEVELKFEFPSSVGSFLQVKLEELSAQPLRQAHDVDSYYDTANFDYLRQAVFVRIRNHKHLEIKYHEHADPLHMHATERVFPLESGPLLVREMNTQCSRFIPRWQQAGTIQEAMRINGLREFACIKKQRTQYEYENMILCVDSVEELGDFFEVETHCEDETKVEQAMANLQDFVTSLACPALRPVKIGYVELWLRSHLPHVYQLGKYQEEGYFDAVSDGKMSRHDLYR